MNWPSIPRHQIETTARDYARMFAALICPGNVSDETERLEARFASYVGCRHAVAVSSGRLGLYLVLKHIEKEPGDEAIVPSLNYFVVIEQILRAGWKPVFGDIGLECLNIDASRVEPLVSPRTRVLLATHMFGAPCEMDSLVDLANRRGLVLIEDCAHALGSRWKGRHVGTFGRAGVFSLSSMKLVTAFGGGMVVTNDDALADGVREELTRIDAGIGLVEGARRFLKGMVLDVGTRTLPFSLGVWPALRLARSIRPDFQQRLMTDTPRRDRGESTNRASGLHAFQVGLAESQLRRADSFIDRRVRVTAHLDEVLSGIDGVRILRRRDQDTHNGMYYGILSERPRELSRYLFKRGIDSETSEYCNCADLALYREFRAECPRARDVQKRLLRLPNHPRMTGCDVERIGRTIRAFHETPMGASPRLAVT